MIDECRSKGINPYPHKFHVSISLTDFIAKYDNLEKDVVLQDTIQSVAGRCSVLIRLLYCLLCFLKIFISRANIFKTWIGREINFLRSSWRRDTSTGARECKVHSTNLDCYEIYGTLKIDTGKKYSCFFMIQMDLHSKFKDFIVVMSHSTAFMTELSAGILSVWMDIQQDLNLVNLASYRMR